MECCWNDSDGGKPKYSEEKAPVFQLFDYIHHIISLRRSLNCAVSFLEILSNVCVKKNTDLEQPACCKMTYTKNYRDVNNC